MITNVRWTNHQDCSHRVKLHMTGNTCWSIPPQQCEHNRILSKAILSLPGRIFLQIQVPHRPRKFMRVFEGDEEGKGDHASQPIAYTLFISQNLKIIPHLIHHPSLPRLPSLGLPFTTPVFYSCRNK